MTRRWRPLIAAFAPPRPAHTTPSLSRSPSHRREPQAKASRRLSRPRAPCLPSASPTSASSTPPPPPSSLAPMPQYCPPSPHHRLPEPVALPPRPPHTGAARVQPDLLRADAAMGVGTGSLASAGTQPITPPAHLDPNPTRDPSPNRDTTASVTPTLTDPHRSSSILTDPHHDLSPLPHRPPGACMGAAARVLLPHVPPRCRRLHRLARRCRVPR